MNKAFMVNNGTRVYHREDPHKAEIVRQYELAITAKVRVVKAVLDDYKTPNSDKLAIAIVEAL